MTKTNFGKIKNGVEASLYEIGNSNGMKVALTDFGATVVSIWVKDKEGKMVDVVTGYDTAAEYENSTCYFGATVGRYANRISDAKVTIEGVEYQLETNDNENNLHSGSNGISEKVWEVKESKDNLITFTCVSKDLEQGFPGNATIDVTYEVTDDNALSISYKAVSDKTTTFNMTNHSYFNLGGHTSGSIYGHKLWIKASGYTPVIDSKAIPTGEVAPVAETPFDFTTPKTVGEEIDADDTQLSYGAGYDHNFAIDKETDGVEEVAWLTSPETGIKMQVYTDCVGIQLYTGNFIGGQVGKGGVKYAKRDALCLETQFFPNSINEPNFLTPITKAGEEFNSKTIYKFSIA